MKRSPELEALGHDDDPVIADRSVRRKQLVGGAVLILLGIVAGYLVLGGRQPPVRDMLDVHALMLNAATVHELWAPGRRCAESARDRRRDGSDSPYLSICAIYRNEAPYLREWVEFHRLAGVERFFLYDNRSTDEHREVLAPRIEDGTVVVREWPDPRGQIPAC